MPLGVLSSLGLSVSTHSMPSSNHMVWLALSSSSTVVQCPTAFTTNTAPLYSQQLRTIVWLLAWPSRTHFPPIRSRPSLCHFCQQSGIPDLTTAPRRAGPGSRVRPSHPCQARPGRLPLAWASIHSRIHRNPSPTPSEPQIAFTMPPWAWHLPSSGHL